MLIAAHDRYIEVSAYAHFGGKPYKWFDYHATKKAALAQAKRLRGPDMAMRIKEQPNGGWNVYARAIKPK